MPNQIVTYQYVYFSSGPHQRQPRSGPGGFTVIETLPPYSAGGNFAAGKLPSTQPVGSDTYNFSFATVSGGLSLMPPNVGEVVGVSTFDPMKPPATVGIGNLPINVLVVYVPPPGNGGTPGAT